MNDDSQKELLNRLRARRALDDRWQLWNFIFYQIVLGISIIASFISAIVAASNLVSPIIVAILAALPGTVIVIDRGFMFSSRWRWHNTMSTKLLALEQRLLFDAETSAKEISEEMTDLLIKMETAYPVGGSVEGAVPSLRKHDGSAG